MNTEALATWLRRFPPGTPVCVTQTIAHRNGPIVSTVVGVVESWEELPTGSWYAFGKEQVPGKGKCLMLARLTLRKADGEVTRLVIDDATTIAQLQPARG